MKLVSLTTDAYDRLKAKKGEGESFSNAVLRLTGKTNLSQFAGILTEKEAEGLEKSIKDLRAKSRARADFVRKELE